MVTISLLKTALCNYVHATGGGKLRSGHAHEIVAAFLGYTSQASLRHDLKVSAGASLKLMSDADLIIVDRDLITQRVEKIEDNALHDPHNTPPVLPTPKQIIDLLHGVIETQLHRAVTLEILCNDGQPWIDQMSDDLFYHLTNLLNGPMAETNCLFDEMELDTDEVIWGEENLVMIGEGDISGTSDEDRVFYGDKITFAATRTYTRCGGRCGLRDARIEADGDIDDSMYYSQEYA
jgi:hypothetical protein